MLGETGRVGMEEGCCDLIQTPPSKFTFTRSVGRSLSLSLSERDVHSDHSFAHISDFTWARVPRLIRGLIHGLHEARFVVGPY